MSSDAEKPLELSVQRSFVVQFDAQTRIEQGRMAGRVEHVVSGRATCFHALEALLNFVAQVLPHDDSTNPKIGA